MTLQHAKLLANKMTNQEIYELLLAAKNGITDWTQPCKLNNSLSLGYAWNMFAKNYDVNESHSEFYKVKVIQLFADWLPEKYKQKKKKKFKPAFVGHVEPDFTNWK